MAMTRALERVSIRFGGPLALAAAAGASAFAAQAQVEAAQAQAWCGDLPSTLSFLGHCLACWREAGLAAAGVLAMAALADRLVPAIAEART